MDADSGEADDVPDEECLSRFLADELGDEVGQDFMEEFKSSELFDELMQQLTTQGNLDNASRRSSQDSQDRGKREFEDPVAGVDNNSSKVQGNASKIVHSDCLPKTYKSQATEAEKKHQTETAATVFKNKIKDNLKICLRKPENEEKKKGSSSHLSVEGNRGTAGSDPLRGKKIHYNHKCSVVVCDLTKIRRAFPDGIRHTVMLTLRLLQEIKNYEDNVKNTMERKRSILISNLGIGRKTPLSATQDKSKCSQGSSRKVRVELEEKRRAHHGDFRKVAMTEERSTSHDSSRKATVEEKMTAHEGGPRKVVGHERSASSQDCSRKVVAEEKVTAHEGGPRKVATQERSTLQISPRKATAEEKITAHGGGPRKVVGHERPTSQDRSRKATSEDKMTATDVGSKKFAEKVRSPSQGSFEENNTAEEKLTASEGGHRKVTEQEKFTSQGSPRKDSVEGQLTTGESGGKITVEQDRKALAGKASVEKQSNPLQVNSDKVPAVAISSILQGWSRVVSVEKNSNLSLTSSQKARKVEEEPVPPSSSATQDSVVEITAPAPSPLNTIPSTEDQPSEKKRARKVTFEVSVVDAEKNEQILKDKPARALSLLPKRDGRSISKDSDGECMSKSDLVTGSNRIESAHENKSESHESEQMSHDTVTQESASIMPEECADNIESGDEKKDVGNKKSSSPERVVGKKKKVIESSSDDGDTRKDDTDTTETPERKKSSDEEHAARCNSRTLQFERKREQIDSRSRKFDRFEHERQRKLGEKKRGKQKSKEKEALEDFLIEKPLPPSFRIPRRSTGERYRGPAATTTPLAVNDVPKENLQFERFRETKNKDKDRKHNDFRGQRQGQDRFKRDQEVYDRSRDDWRVTLLAPEEIKSEDNSDRLHPPPEQDAEPEPCWDDEPEVSTSDNCKDADQDLQDVKIKIEPLENDIVRTQERQDGGVKQEHLEILNVEIPIKEVMVNALAVGVVTLLQGTESIDLPDTDDVPNLAEATVMKLAWWFKSCDIDSMDYDSDSSSSDSDSSYIANLNLTYSEEEEMQGGTLYGGAPDPVEELCGRALLAAQYRTGPGDTFINIFQIRSGAVYEKENFQAVCKLCNQLVVGKVQLATHVLSDTHIRKMSTAGMESAAGVDLSKDLPAVESKDKDKLPKSERDRQPEGSGKSRGDDDKHKSDTMKKHKDKKSEKRKRSKDRSRDKSRDDKPEDAEISHTSTGLPIKIPASAVPVRKRSHSKGHRSRSRSPRHKRTRSRSPHHRNSRSGHRSRSRTPVQRIPRSPTRMREEKMGRSTSAERAEKFIAKNNSSRSPSNGQSHKRHRRSRSRSKTGPVMPKRDNREFNEKLALTAEGKWTDNLERSWKLMEAEEAMYIEQFGEKSKMMKEAPEQHPLYADEWKLFWQQKYQELEDAGKDPDKFDFVPEWKDYWSKKLKTLLETECETEIKIIKKRHGMDIESLQKIRLTKEPKKILPPEPPVISHPTLAVPIPQSLPLSEPSPGATPSSKSDSHVPDDMSARSMSCSEGEEGGAMKAELSRPAGNVLISKGPPVTVTANDVISQWEKLKTGGIGSSRQGNTLVQTTVTQVPSRRSMEEKSEADSGSIASYDFDGFDLVQVLRLMSNLEDQLSFLAPKVQEYFKTAEELDLKKRNKSNELLEQEDFVVLLFQARDRFMALIRANVLPRDKLKSLNLTVYGLNAILDSEPCQKYHASAKLAAVPTSSEVRKNEPELAKERKSETNAPSLESSEQLTPGSSIPSGINASASQKEEVARLLAGFILNMGREDMTDKELQDFVMKILQPATDTTTRVEKQTFVLSDSNASSSVSTSARDSWRVPEASNTLPKTYSVASLRGSAFPTLTSMMPGPGKEGIVNKSSSSETGRHSPFSKRDFTGNPDTESMSRSRDKDEFNMQSGRIPMLPKHFEITTQQLTKSKAGSSTNKELFNDLCKREEQEADTLTTTSPTQTVGLFPPGIMNMIMKERNSRTQEVHLQTHEVDVEQGEVLSETERKPLRFYRKGRRRKRKKYREYVQSDSSSTTTSTERRRQRKKKRKKRKGKNESRRRLPSLTSSEASVSVKSTSSLKLRCRTAPPREYIEEDGEIWDNNKEQFHNNRSPLRESNFRTTGLGYAVDDVESLQASPPLSVVSNYSIKRLDEENSLKGFTCHRSPHPIPRPLYGRDNDDVASNISKISVPNSRKPYEDTHVPNQLRNKCLASKREPVVSKVKVTPVAETFWGSKDDARSLSSISSTLETLEIPTTVQTQVVVPAKIQRQYRVSLDQGEKEPGEISTDSDD